VPDQQYVLVREALKGDPATGSSAALAELVHLLTPVIQARVARSLLKQARTHGGNIQQEVADFTQEVFVQLFSDGGRVLLAWDPERGMSLTSFVGLIAQRHICSLLRTPKNPWRNSAREPSAFEATPADEGGSPERQAASREELQLLLDALRKRLSPLGLEMFYRLYVHKESVEDIRKATGMSAESVYQWRRRLADAAQQTSLALQRASTSTDSSPRVTP
jgi:RNA polymerase sigma-70 factor, ECF subfamily